MPRAGNDGGARGERSPLDVFCWLEKPLTIFSLGFHWSRSGKPLTIFPLTASLLPPRGGGKDDA
jgi:hypothetical protein